jgi:hypothetical protein
MDSETLVKNDYTILCPMTMGPTKHHNRNHTVHRGPNNTEKKASECFRVSPWRYLFVQLGSGNSNHLMPRQTARHSKAHFFSSSPSLSGQRARDEGARGRRQDGYQVMLSDPSRFAKRNSSWAEVSPDLQYYSRVFMGLQEHRTGERVASRTDAIASQAVF